MFTPAAHDFINDYQFTGNKKARRGGELWAETIITNSDPMTILSDPAKKCNSGNDIPGPAGNIILNTLQGNPQPPVIRVVANPQHFA